MWSPQKIVRQEQRGGKGGGLGLIVRVIEHAVPCCYYDYRAVTCFDSDYDLMTAGLPNWQQKIKFSGALIEYR